MNRYSLLAKLPFLLLYVHRGGGKDCIFVKTFFAKLGLERLLPTVLLEVFWKKRPKCSKPHEISFEQY
jgi:hypothetical protein